MKIRRLELDYLVPPRRSRWAGALLLALSLLVAGDLALRSRDTQLALQRLDAAQGLLSTERRPARAASRERVDEQLKNAEASIRQLALPWAGLIETVEDAATHDVAILQLQPDAQQRLLRLSAEARHQAAMIQYLERLAAEKGLSEVHLLSHQMQQDDPQQPIQFAVQASFRGMQ